MNTGIVLGCLLGGSLCLLVFALWPPRPALSAAVTRWERQRLRTLNASTAVRTGGAGYARDGSDDGSVGSEVPQTRLTVWRGVAGSWMVAHLDRRGITMTKIRADLEINDRSLEDHLVRKVRAGLVGLLAPQVFVLIVLAGGIRPPFTVPALIGLGLAAVMFMVPDTDIRRAAERRRAELRRALSCYLDLVAMSLAGGRGIPEALPTAARIGTGWAFGLLDDTIGRARRTGDAPWAALGDLGRRVGLQELQDLGGALLLVADDGAKVRDSLTARAGTQRRRQLAEAEGAASRADQSIQMAQVVLGAGFFLFLAYPAVIAVLAV